MGISTRLRGLVLGVESVGLSRTRGSSRIDASGSRTKRVGGVG